MNLSETDRLQVKCEPLLSSQTFSSRRKINNKFYSYLYVVVTTTYVPLILRFLTFFLVFLIRTVEYRYSS